MTPTLQRPRRRWWHKYVVLEQNLTSGVISVSSWHMSYDGAAHTVGRLIAHYWCEERGRYVTDAFDWRALPAGHHLVREILSAPVTT